MAACESVIGFDEFDTKRVGFHPRDATNSPFWLTVDVNFKLLWDTERASDPKGKPGATR
jgi:hypothetical protein